MLPDYDQDNHNNVDDITTGEVILLSLKIYGSVFLSSFILFVIVRPKFPLAYNFCNSVKEYNTKLSQEHYGHIRWMWKIFQYSDDEIFESCGLTAAVFLRFLVLGLKVTLVGIFNSIYLIPVNLNGCNIEDDECNSISDVIEHIGLGNVSRGNMKLVATVVSAYVIFLSTMYLIYKEFEWFTEARHRFLTMPRVDNYSIYVKHIPMEYRGDVALMEYFKSIVDADNVVDAKIALDISNLEKKVAYREKTVFKLENAMNKKEKNATEPTHLTVIGQAVESIPFYKEEIKRLNEEISETISSIEIAKEEEKNRYMAMVEGSGTSISPAFNLSKVSLLETLHENQNDETGQKESSASEEEDKEKMRNSSPNSSTDLLDDDGGRWKYDASPKKVQNSSLFAEEDKSVATEATDVDNVDEIHHDTPKNPFKSTLMKTAEGIKKTANVVQDGVKKSADVVQKGVQKTVNFAQDGAINTVSGVKEIGAKSVQVATNLIWGSNDGQVRDGGFVTFKTLSAKAQCVQMIHHQTPFCFQVSEAPLPKEIFWNNVGLSHETQQIGFITAQVLTGILCVFWTIPVTFITSLAEVNSLKKTIPFLETAIENHPWIEQLLAQLNPILLVILKALIPIILSKISEREGHVSQNDLNASVLAKLAIFLIIQIFFVPAISGSIFSALPGLIENWREVMNLLATSVPGQVKFFIQFVSVNAFLSCSFELLRIVKVTKAFARQFIGPNLSEKERARPFMGLEPLTEPDKVEFPTVFADIILYIMILLVYSCIAPIMSYVMLLIFTILLITYKNQFIYIYNAKYDQGGALWSKTIRSLLLVMFIAEFALIGVMSLKHSVVSSTLLIPLLIITALFALYLEQQHYKVTIFLPSTICKHVDEINKDLLDKSFLQGQYVQPALKANILIADGMDSESEEEEEIESQIV